MIAITLLLAGVVIIIVAQFMDHDTETGEIFLFEVEADDSDDVILVSLMKGTLRTSRMTVLLDGNALNQTYTEISAGDTLSIPAGTDIVQGSQYDITITVDNKVTYQGTVTARK